jgi:hypothetical protein
MEVLVRPKQRESSIMRRRRHGATAHSSGPAATSLPITRAASPRRHSGPSQDQALYSCSCGFVFEALVSTSVGCPHCGDKQAW